jgi:hypothetical protein
MSNDAIANARAHLADIVKESAAIREDGDATNDEGQGLLEAWQERPLSLMIRDGWRAPGASSPGVEEYEILLTTGGPGLRIVGEVEDGEPSSARLEWQDWGISWTQLDEPDSESAEALLHFAQQFYFGEG